jgi:hypothetical protein
MATQVASKRAAAAQNGSIEKRPTSMHHIFLIDWNDDGLLKEIAVVMETQDGAIWGIEVEKLHPIDKVRLKKVITSVHADKYPLWELLSQGRLGNGMNALDFFHQNYVKIKNPRGSVTGGGSLLNVSLDMGSNLDDSIIGSKFSDPRGAAIATEQPKF